MSSISTDDLTERGESRSDLLDDQIEPLAADVSGDVKVLLRMAFEARQEGRIDDSRGILETAAQRFPAEAHVQHDLARLEEAERNWPEAERRWRLYVQMNPTAWWGPVQLARALREQGRIAEAETLLADKQDDLSDAPGVFIEHAWLAEIRRDWPEAAARWSVVTERFPEAPEGLPGQARASLQQGHRDGARALLFQAMERFPNHAEAWAELAKLEELDRNWPEAERRWREFAELRPATWWGHTRIAFALSQQGRVDEAETLLTEALGRFSDEAGVFIGYARLAEFRRDWPEAAVRWSVVKERFAEAPEALSGQARALLMQGHRDGARTLLLQAMARFPGDIDSRVELAKLEELDRNWSAAEQQWREFAELRPTVWWGPTRVAFALCQQGRTDEAETILAEALARFPDEAGVFIEYARLSELARDWTEAASRWGTVSERFPQSWQGLTGQARALRELGQTEAARALLVRAVADFPEATHPLHDLARLHEADRHWPAAEQCWRDLIALDPSPWWAHAGLATALIEQGRQAEAEAVLTEQFERMAGEPAIFIAHARLAERVADWQEAERRWFDVAARFPHIWDGFGGQVRSLRQQQRLEEASAVLGEAYDRFAGLDGPLRERADLAEAIGDWADAEAAWRALVAMDQRFWWFYGHLIRCECKQGRIADAFATFADAKGRFPGSLNLIIDFARTLIDEGYAEPALEIVADALSGAYDPTAHELMHLARMTLRCEDLDRAIDTLHRLRINPPGDPWFVQSLSHFENTLSTRLAELAPAKLDRLAETAASPGVSDDDEVLPDPAAMSTAALMMRFESLGGDVSGCEIGLVQRRFGAEPLGLLRWTSVPPARLIEAMRSGFEGVGSLQQTELVVRNDDYWTYDSRFDMNMLTFCSPADIEFSEMHEQAIERISFLREKLISDLQETDKIFVYRTLYDSLTVDEIKQLKEAMSLYGTNRLLYLRLADVNHPVGSVTIEAPDLCFGYVEAFSDEPVRALHLNGWLSVFEQADSDWSLAFEPASVAAETNIPEAATDWLAHEPDEPAPPEAPVAEAYWSEPESAPAPVVEVPAKEGSWLRRAAGLFGARSRK